MESSQTDAPDRGSMIAADTNLFVRWLTNDDKAQAESAARLFRAAEKTNEPIWVADMVVGELVWVLQRVFRLRPPQVAEMVEPIIAAPMLAIENRDRLMRAMELFAAHNVDFIDCYIASSAIEKGLKGVASFDRDFDKLPVRRIEP